MIEAKSSGYQFASTVYSVKEVLNGKDVLTLTVPAKGEDAQRIVSELVLVEKTYSKSEFVVKAIDGDDDETEVTANLNLDDFNVEIFEGFNKTGRPYNILNEVVPSGWTVDDRSGISSSKTVELEAPTAEEVADSVIDVFGVAIRYDFEHHLQVVYNLNDVESNGEYVTKELNLVSLYRYQSSYDLVNRLYVYGKDGLSFADINDGKPYVDDMSYLKDRIRSKRIKDDRFTDKESLLEYAKSTLAALSKPVSSYECTPADIGATNTRYAFLKLELMSVVTLLDVDTNTRVDHQVVERVIWPYDKIRNSLTLSAAAPSFTGKLDSVVNQITTETNKIDKKIEDYVGDLTDKILTASGGHVVINYGDDGKMAEILLMDTNNKATAVNVMRFNMNGIAFSTSGYNGPFNGIMGLDGKWFSQYLATWELSASIIILGILQSQDGETFYLDLENGILRMKANEFTIQGKTIPQVADEQIAKISLSVEETDLSNAFEPSQWVYDESLSTLEDGVLTIPSPTSGTANNGGTLDVPKSKLESLKGVSATLTLEYKVNTAINTGSDTSGMVLWHTYDSGNEYVWAKVLYNSSSGTTPVSDWQQITVEVNFKDEVPTKVYFFAYMYPGQGSVSIRNVKLIPPVTKGSSLSLTKDGVVLSSVETDFVSQQDYTQLKMDQESLSLEVVKNGQVRSAFAADSSSITISSGVVTFNSNTLVINGTNFHLDSSGNVSITGSFSANKGDDHILMQEGFIRLTRDDSSGINRETASMWSSGGNGPHGILSIYGPGSDGSSKINFQAEGNYQGGRMWLYDANRSAKFQVTVGGDGQAYLNLNDNGQITTPNLEVGRIRANGVWHRVGWIYNTTVGYNMLCAID